MASLEGVLLSQDDLQRCSEHGMESNRLESGPREIHKPAVHSLLEYSILRWRKYKILINGILYSSDFELG